MLFSIDYGLFEVIQQSEVAPLDSSCQPAELAKIMTAKNSVLKKNNQIRVIYKCFQHIFAALHCGNNPHIHYVVHK